MTDVKEMWDAIKSRFGGNDESKKMQKYILKQQFEGFSVSNTEGLHKGYDRFQSLLSQLEIHGAGVSTEDANQKFLRSLPSAWSQVSLIMRTKPGVDSLSFDDLYNNLRVFESDIKGSTASSSSPQNVAFVSENTSSTNDVSIAYCVSNPSGQKLKDLEQLDEYDLEEMDLKWQVTMISMRMKKFYKKTGRKLQFDAKEPVGFDKTKVECYNCHKTCHFARECRTKGNQDSRRRDASNSGNKDGRRSGKQEDSKVLVTIDGEGVDWTSHSEEEDYALMACNSSGSDSEVTACSNECKESYVKLKKLYDAHREQLSDASIEIKAYTQGLKKVEAQLVAHQQGQQWYGNHRYDGILSYENEVLQSVFMNKESELEKQPLYDRFVTADGMHAVPPPMTGNYMPSGPDIEVDYSQFTYGPKQTQPSESESQTSEFDTCDSNISTEPSELVSEPVVNESNVECQPKVWSDAPIIEEYESDSEDEDCDFHDKRMARKAELNNGWENVQRVNKQNQFVPSTVLTRTGKIPVSTIRVSGTKIFRTARQSFNRQTVLTCAGMEVNTVKPTVNRVRPANVFHKTHSRPFKKTTVLITDFSKQKVNTAKEKAVSTVGGKKETAVKLSAGCNWRPQRNNWYNVSKYNGGSSLRNCYTFKDPLGNQAPTGWWPVPRHMLETMPTLLNSDLMCPVAFGGSKGYITGKGKIKTGKLDFEDVCFVKELQHFNLFSLSQMCDKKNKVLFTDSECLVLSPEFKLPDENQVLLKIPRQNNMYSFNLKNIVPSGGLACLIAKATTDESNKWHWRLGHVNFKNLNKLVKGNLVRGLPSKIFQNDHTCVACQKGKQHKASWIKREYSNARTPQQNGVVERKNMTLIEAARTMLADSFLPNTFWAEAVSTACYVLNRVLVTKPHNKTPYELLTGTEDIIDAGDSEKEDESAQDCFVLPIWPSYSSTISPDLKTDEKREGPREEEQVFLDELERLKRQEKEANEEAEALRKEFAQDTENLVIQAGAAKASSTNIFSTVSTPAKASSTNLVNTVSTPVSTASPHEGLTLSDPTNPEQDDSEIPPLEDIYQNSTDGIFTTLSYDDEGAMADFTNLETVVNVTPIPTSRIHSSHPSALIIGDPTSAVQTRSKLNKNSRAHAFVSYVLVDLPYGKKAIGTKWVYRNKKDERGVVVRNKARLVAQGHRQEEGIDYDEVFEPVARIEAIRIFLAFASYMGFIVYQMDVKSDFLYGKIDEEVYVSQPPGFLDPKYPQKVYKVVKALYGLHQAPRAWYTTLSTFLLKNGYKRGTIDKTLFIKKDKHDIILVQVYVDDIIFGSTKKSWCDEFEALMKKILKKFDFANVKTASTPIETQKPLVKDEEASDVDVHLYRSMIGSLMYLTASRPDIMFVVCACSRFQVTPKSSHLSAVKRIFRYLKGKPKLGLWYPRVSSFDLESYSDSDYAGANLDRKSTTGGCQFLGRRLISWQCKKQTIVATSTIEAEYVAAASYCGKVLWIQNQMLDYGFNFMNTKIYIDNESTICIVKNPVYHSKTKHIAIRHHFIRDAYEKKLIQVLKIHTDDNVADLLTKAFDVSRESLRRVIDGIEALLLPTLFILWLNIVSTDNAKLVPLGKVCTAIETLKKNTAKALISLLTTITRKTTMAIIDSCPKHNMVAYLEKTEGNAEFHEIIDFLKRNSIHHALTVSPVVSTTFVEHTTTPSPAPTSEVPIEPQTESSPAHTSEVPIEQQTDPSPRPSPSNIIPDSIPESSGGNLRGHSSSDKSLSGNEGEMTL
ncbi:putative ribonuclease H-like domain-containing protein [Tanacetum coccineum]